LIDSHTFVIKNYQSHLDVVLNEVFEEFEALYISIKLPNGALL
jgi:hypothetical protein